MQKVSRTKQSLATIAETLTVEQQERDQPGQCRMKEIPILYLMIQEVVTCVLCRSIVTGLKIVSSNQIPFSGADQGIKVTSQLLKSKMCSYNLTFDPCKSSDQEPQKQTIKHTFTKHPLPTFKVVCKKGGVYFSGVYSTCMQLSGSTIAINLNLFSSYSLVIPTPFLFPHPLLVPTVWMM